jgi:hypothetical protein
MKSFTPFFLAALASRASAHYIFERLTHGGTEYAVYQYIRENTNYNSPVIDLTSNDMRCNQGGENNTVGSTATITMAAGDSFTFTADVAVYHDGPLSIYMSKAPSTAASYDGSGSWFKILDIGPDFSSGSAVWNLAQSYTYTIPKALPSGDYLLRIQQLGIHNPYPAGIPQFYIECAQVTVTGGGSGTPGPLVSIPGFIKGDEPGYVVNFYTDFTNYTVPGPAVWSGQNAAGSGTSPTSPTTTAKATTTVAGTTSTTAAAAPTGAVVPKYGQCGGIGWTGGTVCATGSTCTASGSYYSQCL